MSFKETDFPGLMVYLKKLLAEEKDPLLFRELVAQIVQMYDQIPVYPGIVNMCVGQSAKAIDPKEVEVGQKIFVRNHDDCFSGRVSEKNDDGIVLKEALTVAEDEELELGFKEMEKVTLVNENTLKEIWPSLVFDKEQ
jgi:hypothetical protein